MIRNFAVVLGVAGMVLSAPVDAAGSKTKGRAESRQIIANAILGSPLNGGGRASCAIDRILGLEPWGSDQAAWADKLRPLVQQVVNRFVSTATFEPFSVMMDGNVATVSSVDIERIVHHEQRNSVRKVRVGYQPGTRIPIYQIQPVREPRVQINRIVVRSITIRLPVMTEDAPGGAVEARISATCEA